MYADRSRDKKKILMTLCKLYNRVFIYISALCHTFSLFI